MPFTLQVIPTADADAQETHAFDSAVVVIGRDASVDLPLDDPARVVSKRHAEVRHAAGALTLVDLGSKNGTVLNGRRLRSGEAVPLHEADAFEVGDFQIRIEHIEASDDVAEEPTADAVERGAAALAATGGETRAAPRDTGGHTAAVPPELPGSEPLPEEPSAAEDPLEIERLPDGASDVLVEAVSRLAALPWHFRHEFIGQTIAPPEGMAVFAEGLPDALRRFLLDPRLDPDEKSRRHEALAAAAEAGVLHQVAMLDGYKAAIEAGTRHVLETLDPEAAVEEARQGGFWRRLPVLREAAALKRLRQAHRDLAQEDAAVAERGRFRPAFIKAYLARMTRRGEAPDPDSSSLSS